MPKKPELDALDMRIIEVLQEQGDITNKDLADKVDLSPPATLKRVQALKDKSYLLNNRQMINWRKLGFNCQMLTLVRVDSTASAIIHMTINSFKELKDYWALTSRWLSNPNALGEYFLLYSVHESVTEYQVFYEHVHSFEGVFPALTMQVLEDKALMSSYLDDLE